GRCRSRYSDQRNIAPIARVGVLAGSRQPRHRHEHSSAALPVAHIHDSRPDRDQSLEKV
ncbi:MAG: hypothetical protein AVDCRST_MAG87-1637, partial [uncultured Thermomicrobiales bacterium]